ncbi:hypothetical protein [Streptococcus orisasini]|uniref:hypothetical protein n=1 Tax=Streptococcus orisasini TaxID=1080071 RepID=UPI0007099E28|nr:hypothetical protein [Streptococcus orisasini]
MKKRFLHVDSDFLGHLNTLGMTFLFLIVILVIPNNNSINLRMQEQILLVSISLFGTMKHSSVLFPYHQQKLGTFFIKRRYILRHILISVYYIYRIQFVLTIVALCYLVSNHSVSLTLAFLGCAVIAINLLSHLLSGMSAIINQILFLGSLFYLSQGNIDLLVLNLLASLLILIVYTLSHFRIDDFLFRFIKYERSAFSDVSLLKLQLIIFKNNLFLLFLIIVFNLLITYFGQLFFNHLNRTVLVPVTFLYTSIYLALLELLIGNHSEDIDIDSTRHRLMILNNHLTLYDRFKVSSLYLWTVYANFIHLTALPALVASSPFIVTVKAVILVILNILIAFTYFRKLDYLVYEERNHFLRYSFLLLYLICIICMSLGG